MTAVSPAVRCATTCRVTLASDDVIAAECTTTFPETINTAVASAQMATSASVMRAARRAGRRTGPGETVGRCRRR